MIIQTPWPALSASIGTNAWNAMWVIGLAQLEHRMRVGVCHATTLNVQTAMYRRVSASSAKMDFSWKTGPVSHAKESANNARVSKIAQNATKSMQLSV